MFLPLNNHIFRNMKTWVGVLAFLIFPQNGFSAAFQLKLVTNTQKVITELTWDASRDTQTPVLRLRSKSGRNFYFVILSGKFSGNALLYKNMRIPIKKDGSFDLELEITGESTQFSLASIDARGLVQTTSGELLFPEWKNLKKSTSIAQEKKLQFQLGIGAAAVNYNQTNYTSTATNNFNQIGLDALTSLRYQGQGSFGFGGQASFTAYPVGLSATGSSIRLLNMDAQVFYSPRPTRSTWKFELLADYSYRAAFSTQAKFGYSNIQGITLYPRIEKLFAGNRKFWAQIKFMPIMVGFSFANLTSYEVSTQLGYQGIRVGSHWINFILNGSMFSYQYSTLGDAGSLRVNCATFGLNFLF